MTSEFDVTCYEAVQDLARGNEAYRNAVAAIRQQWLAIDRKVEQKASPFLDQLWSTLAGGNAAALPASTGTLPPYFGRMNLADDGNATAAAAASSIEEQRKGTNALASHIAAMIDQGGASERDDELLQHLQRVSSTTLDAPEVGFEVQFTFSSAVRAYIFAAGSDDDAFRLGVKCECDPVDLHIKRIHGTKIPWKKGFNPTVMEVDPTMFGDDDDDEDDTSAKRDKKQAKKATSKAAPSMVKTIPCPSFFNIFQSFDLERHLSQKAGGPQPVDPQQLGEKIALARALEQFHSFAALTPAHSFWFPPNASDEMDDGFGLGDDMDFGEEEEDEEDDDEEEEEEEAPPARKKSRVDGAKPPAQAPGKKPECKQQ